jgi:hypothetical protein
VRDLWVEPLVVEGAEEGGAEELEFVQAPGVLHDGGVGGRHKEAATDAHVREVVEELEASGGGGPSTVQSRC